VVVRSWPEAPGADVPSEQTTGTVTRLAFGEMLARELDAPMSSARHSDEDGQGASPDAARAFSLLLLADTYDYARAKCRLYGTYPLERLTRLSEFGRLPVLERATLVHDLPAVCVESTELLHHTATSGTTTGHSMFIPRSRREQALLEKYRRTVASFSAEGAAHEGVTLRLVPGGRLIPGGVGSSSDQIGVFNLNMARQNLWDNWDYLISQLFAEFPVGWSQSAITLIHATPPCGLVLLTRYMLERGVEPSQTSVRRLVVSGGWTSRVTRRWLQDAWQAEFATAYSCAELNEPARECRLVPGRFHFPLPVYPEVVALGSHEPVEVGECGRLLLTGAYPFHQACMLIRYAVGDWVRWLGDARCECGVHARTIEFLGRESTLVRLDLPSRDPLLLPSVPTLEALSRFRYVPDIPRQQYRWDFAGDQGLVLHAECYAVGGRAWRARAEAEIAASALDEHPHLAAAVRDGLRFRVELHARSNLTVNIGMR
jgi:phenylacetate-coenzyme A ligase PaaK-like adenylate-forming protein